MHNYDICSIVSWKPNSYTVDLIQWKSIARARELIDYEKSLHRAMDIPMIAICAYNANHINKTKNPINIYTELARAHGTVLFTGVDNRLGRMELRKV